MRRFLLISAFFGSTTIARALPQYIDKSNQESTLDTDFIKGFPQDTVSNNEPLQKISWNNEAVLDSVSNNKGGQYSTNSVFNIAAQNPGKKTLE